MPMSEVVKKVIEDDIVSNFGSVTVPIREDDFAENVVFDTIIAHPDQWIADQSRKDATTRPGIYISYPSEGINRMRFAGNSPGKRQVYSLNYSLVDEVPDSYDTITPGNYIDIDFYINEPNIGYVEIYTGRSLNPTSTIIAELWNKTHNKILSKKYVGNLVVVDQDWTKINIGKDFIRVDSITGLTDELRLRLKVQSTGTNPVGIDFYKNAASDYLMRTYKFNISRVYAVINEHRMRIEIRSKHKHKESLPSVGKFIGHQQIANSYALQMQEYILGNWHDLGSGVTFERMEGETQGTEYLDTEFIAKNSFDVIFLGETVGVEEEIVFKDMELLEVNKV